MENITFEQLPNAVAELYHKVVNIEQLLLASNSQDSTEKDRILTIQDASKFLTLSIPTIYSLVSRSAIPVNKRGKRLYFSKQELTDWIRSGRKKTNYELSIEAHTQLLDNNKKRE